jgi:hypothetical protein
MIAAILAEFFILWAWYGMIDLIPKLESTSLVFRILSAIWLLQAAVTIVYFAWKYLP